jgi:uncharacterized protein YecT (DUF1311 family)
MMKLLPALLLVSLSAPASASQMLTRCESDRDTSVAYLRCLDRQIQTLNRHIDLWGNNMIFALEEISKKNGRSDALRLFKKSQKTFTKYVEQNCRWQFLVLLPDRTSAAIKFKTCMIEMSGARVVELKRVSGK